MTSYLRPIATTSAALLCIAALMAPPSGAEESPPVQTSTTDRIWFDEPAPVATDRYQWQSSVLPLGNGTLGGMVFGGVEKDRIHFNDKTLWSGGPSASRPDYNGGNRTTPVTRETIEDFARKLDDKSSDVFGMPFAASNTYLTRNIIDPSAWKNGMGMYQDFGDLNLDFSGSGATFADAEGYVRELDLQTGIATVGYTVDGVAHRRESLASHPDEVLATRLTADAPGSVSVNVTLTGAQRGGTVTAGGDTVTLRGALADNQLVYEAQVKVVAEGGRVTTGASGIQVDGADSVTLYLATGTDYANRYPTYRGDDPHAAVSSRVADAAAKGYEAVRADHVADHSGLYSRVRLDLGDGPADLPTDERLARYRKGAADPALEALAFQYGRYLSIASSRPGGLPSNLNGVWMIGSGSQFWNADYHFNINVQMNYWPNLVTNLAETAEPFNDWMESLRVPGRVTAGATSATPSGPGEENGFLVHTVNNIFGLTAPYAVQEFGWNIGGSAWALKNVDEYFEFTQDETYLRERIYPMQRDLANFCLSYLWHSDYQDRLVVTPSVSAEQGPTVNGSTYDQSLVWQLFEDAARSAERLGVDADLAARWGEAQAQLKPISIGDSGQIREWFEETTFGRAQAGDLPETDIPNWNAGYRPLPHRHLSHLVGLYPGTLITPDDPDAMQAARVSLEERGFESTGWGKAHRLNLWARALDGEQAHRALTKLVGPPKGNAGLMNNLLASHGQGVNHDDTPVLQVEANFGLTAGVAEMLLQSHLGSVDLLPALPEAWADGSVSGLKARGDFELSYAWTDGALDSATVASGSGNDLTLSYEGLDGFALLDGEGRVLRPSAASSGRATYPTEAGHTYRLVKANRVTVQVGEGGTVTDDATGAELASGAGLQVPLGRPVELTAAPSPCHRFDGWFGPDGAVLGTEAALSMEVTADTTVTARFVEHRKKVSFLDFRNKPIASATACELTGLPTTTHPSGRRFEGWAVKGGRPMTLDEVRAVSDDTVLHPVFGRK